MGAGGKDIAMVAMIVTVITFAIVAANAAVLDIAVVVAAGAVLAFSVFAAAAAAHILAVVAATAAVFTRTRDCFTLGLQFLSAFQGLRFSMRDRPRGLRYFSTTIFLFDV